MSTLKGPKVLIFDIETAPMLAYIWRIWDESVGLNQIKDEWHVLSWAAKWLGDDKVMYMDQRNAKNVQDDKKILKEIWKLLDEADIVVTQNGKSFDQKKLFARFIFNGMKPPSSFKHIDTLEIAKKHFAFTSNKLAFMSDKLCVKYKKLNDKDKEFPGFEMWSECLKGNQRAWKEMERYNKQDVLSLEELYTILIPWDKGINFNLYHDSTDVICRCGNTHFTKNGYAYTASSKFQRYVCTSCGSETRSKENLFSKDKRKSLRI